MSQYTPKEKFLLANTLNCIPICLKGSAVLIDLRDETCVAGRIDNADGYMNIHLSEAVFIDRFGKKYMYDNFMIRERMIRQIHLPSNVDVNAEIRTACQSGFLKRPSQNKLTTKKTFRQKCTQNRHNEILREIANKELKKSKPVT